MKYHDLFPNAYKITVKSRDGVFVALQVHQFDGAKRSRINTTVFDNGYFTTRCAQLPGTQRWCPILKSK